MASDSPHRVEVGRGGCWFEGYVCNEDAVPGDYFCLSHGKYSWGLDRVIEGGDTGKVLLNRHPTADPDLEGGAGRSPS